MAIICIILLCFASFCRLPPLELEAACWTLQANTLQRVSVGDWQAIVMYLSRSSARQVRFYGCFVRWAAVVCSSTCRFKTIFLLLLYRIVLSKSQPLYPVSTLFIAPSSSYHIHMHVRYLKVNNSTRSYLSMWKEVGEELFSLKRGWIASIIIVGSLTYREANLPHTWSKGWHVIYLY